MLRIGVIASAFCLVLAGTLASAKLANSIDAQPYGAQRFAQSAGPPPPPNPPGTPPQQLRQPDTDGGRVRSADERGPARPVGPPQPSAPVPHPPQANYWLGEPKNVAALIICTLIVVGGLFVFDRRMRQRPADWASLSVQTLGTIFFFPTLILLGIYLDLTKDAITTILGAFIGYLFGQSRPSGSDDRGSPPPTTTGPSEQGRVAGPTPGQGGGAAAATSPSTYPPAGPTPPATRP
jgi:hypothetical protein